MNLIQNLVFVIGVFLLGSVFSFVVGQAQFVYGLPFFFVLLCISFLLHWIVFVPSYFFRTERFYDITGTLAYLTLLVVSIIFINLFSENPIELRSIVITSMVAVWSVRLGIYLFIRILNEGEDKRFREIKASFSKFLLSWSMSAFWVFMTSINAIAAITQNSRHSDDLFFYVGTLLWITGFCIEVIADEQKRRFKSNPSNQGKFITEGLWSFSRHPNYLGEILLWTGIAIISIPILEGWLVLTLVSPIFVFLLINYISGVNLLEQRADEKWGMLEKYQEYKKKTPVLFPFFF
jgi:steroid 5-alpha reductase family enzyme